MNGRICFRIHFLSIGSFETRNHIKIRGKGNVYAPNPKRLNGHTLFCFIMLNLWLSYHMEIIAEIGQNHNGDLKLAKEMIHAAKENGAEVAKFQLFDAKALFPKENNPWYSHNLNAELSREDAEPTNIALKRALNSWRPPLTRKESVGWKKWALKGTNWLPDQSTII